MNEDLPDRQWSTVFDELFDAVVVLRAIRDDLGRVVDFRIEYANEAWDDIAGRDREAVIGRPLLEVFPGLEQSHLYDAYVQVVETSRPFEEHDAVYEDVIAGRAVRRVSHVRAVKFGDGLFVTRRAGAHPETDRDAARRFDLLVRTSHALDVRLNSEVVLRTLSELLVPEFVDACEIDLVVGNRLERMVAAAGGRREHLKRRESSALTLDADHPIADVVRRGEPAFAEIDSPNADFYFGPVGAPLTARAMGLTAVAIVPLLGRNGVLGAMSVGMGPSGRRFGPADVEVLTVVGRRVAASVENAQLYERARAQSVTLQRALLPDALPSGSWFDIGCRYRPGTEEDEVGGDWYDAHLLGHNELAFTIGDVAGRGIAAAAVMGQLRSAIAALQLDRHAPPAVLDRIERLHVRPPTLATVLCGHLAADGRLRWSSAGHPPPLLLSHTGTARLLETHPGPPVGAGTTATSRMHEEYLSRGDVLVLFTDGLIERRGELIDVGLDHLVACASELSGTTPDHIADGLLHSVGGDDSFDDVAILALRFTG